MVDRDEALALGFAALIGGPAIGQTTLAMPEDAARTFLARFESFFPSPRSYYVRLGLGNRKYVFSNGVAIVDPSIAVIWKNLVTPGGWRRHTRAPHVSGRAANPSPRGERFRAESLAMSDRDALLATYADHVRTRVAAGGGRAALPDDVAAFAREQPPEALAMIIATLDASETPEQVRVVGDGLLEVLLNEHSDALAPAVSAELRRSKRFRQAFAFGEYASVDPAVLGEWIDVLASLGTSKKALRRGLWSKRNE